ncbi:Protein of unknown function [Pyronema omphalodes CBS 100304]|uniref:Uncharacterized protein n=1 Tax=Pyronema omphalodes (strain CBS 100304) TaxID=1076935 RepID=U4L1E0_PYROM|nr:Protein of unknown function [Pyronema omphalodes CBS 100304]
MTNQEQLSSNAVVNATRTIAATTNAITTNAITTITVSTQVRPLPPNPTMFYSGKAITPEERRREVGRVLEMARLAFDTLRKTICDNDDK